MEKPSGAQHLGAKEAEVRFRSNAPPPDASEAEALAQRWELWWRPLRDHLALQGRPGEPFLEVACGGRPRAALLTSEYGLQGFTLDISLQSLLNARRRMEILRIKPQPLLVCADADALPFPDHSLGFLMSSGFLHHLSEPGPFLAEVRRVLGPGRYHFDGEPFAPRFRLHLYRRSRDCSTPEERGRHALVRFVNFYTSDPRCLAAEEGVLERMDLRLRDWRRILEGLPGLQYRATALDHVWKADPLKARGPSALLFDLLGGDLEGDWINCEAPHPSPPSNLTDILACPTCHGSLKVSPSTLDCGRCGEAYPVVLGIPILIGGAARRRLYPSVG